VDVDPIVVCDWSGWVLQRQASNAAVAQVIGIE